MNFKLQLSKQRRETLERMQEEGRAKGDFILFRRCSALLLLAMGLYHDKVSQGLGVCERAVEKWVTLYLSKGARALYPKKPSGRRPKLNRTQRQELYEQIKAGPQKNGYATGVWTGGLIQEHIQKRFGVFYCVKYISQLLRKMGLRHIKPKFSYSLSKEELKKQLLWIQCDFNELWERVKRAGGVLLFLDESSFQLQSNLVHTWAPCGAPPTEVRNAKRGSLRVIGAIELFTGHLTYTLVAKRVNSRTFADFLYQIGRKYRGQEVFIAMDNATYHQGDAVRKFELKHPHVHLERLPKKGPHLNPIEKLWKEVKKLRTHNIYFPTKLALRQAINSGMRSFQQQPERIRSLMNKWEQVAHDPKGARQGKYDSSLLPEKYHHMLLLLQKDIKKELRSAS